MQCLMNILFIKGLFPIRVHIDDLQKNYYVSFCLIHEVCINTCLMVTYCKTAKRHCRYWISLSNNIYKKFGCANNWTFSLLSVFDYYNRNKWNRHLSNMMKRYEFVHFLNLQTRGCSNSLQNVVILLFHVCHLKALGFFLKSKKSIDRC